MSRLLSLRARLIGVIALITPELPTVIVALEDSVLEKNISNIEEVKARKGPIIAIGDASRSIAPGARAPSPPPPT